MTLFQRPKAATLLAAWAVATVVVAASLLLDLAAAQSDGFGADREPYPYKWPIPAGRPPLQLHQHAAPYDIPASHPPSDEEATPHRRPLPSRHHTILHARTGLGVPDHRLLKAVVVGQVLCRWCHERRPLPGARFAVSCWSEGSEASFYGTTGNDGLYHIQLAGFDYEKYGGNACRAKLVAAPPESPCAMPSGVTAMGPARLHIKSKSDDDVVLFSETFQLEAAFSLTGCQGSKSKPRPSPGHEYRSFPPGSPYRAPLHYDRLSPVIPHAHQNHLPPPLIHPLRPYAYQSPPPPHSGSLHPPPLPCRSSFHSPPPYSYHAPTHSPQYSTPHHEYPSPQASSHEHIMPPPPHTIDYLYTPPASYHNHAYPSPQTHTPPLYYKPPPELLPPYKYESPPQHPSSGYHKYTHTPPQLPIRSPVLPHDLAPPSIPHMYHSPPPAQLLPPYIYQPPPVKFNIESPPQSN